MFVIVFNVIVVFEDFFVDFVVGALFDATSVVVVVVVIVVVFVLVCDGDGGGLEIWIRCSLRCVSIAVTVVEVDAVL